MSDVPNGDAATTVVTNEQRYARGLEVLRRIGGPDFDVQLKAAARTAPDLARLTVEFAYGDIIAREGLALVMRQVVTVAALLGHRNAERQLRYHMNAYLNVGGEPQTLVELLFVAIAVLGFPVAIHAISLVRDIFKERGVEFAPIAAPTDDGTERQCQGFACLSAMLSDADATHEAWAHHNATFARWSVEFEYGELFARPALDQRTRQLAIVVMLATAGNRTQQLERHVAAALRAGLSAAELTEAFMQLAVYAGFPTALNAISVATDVFARDSTSTVVPAPVSRAVSESRAVRQQRGLATLAQTSRSAGTTVVASFDDLAPAIGQAIIEHAYGDVFARREIDLRSRELAACAAFAAVGNQVMGTPLRVHVQAALTAGATRDEITEVLLNLVPHCGYPAVEEALRIASEVFQLSA
jgi:4-carboxymuconolactone decarboxylase